MDKKQLYFSLGVSEALNVLKCAENGSYVIKRIKNTTTTHLINTSAENDGARPYPGITKDTCSFNIDRIIGRDIILIDDIYTSGVNVDEDCIQALFDLGAKRIVFYSIGGKLKR